MSSPAFVAKAGMFITPSELIVRTDPVPVAQVTVVAPSSSAAARALKEWFEVPIDTGWIRGR